MTAPAPRPKSATVQVLGNASAAHKPVISAEKAQRAPLRLGSGGAGRMLAATTWA